MRKNIIITGASSGLGEGMAKAFAKRGRNLGLCARRLDRLEVLKADLLKINPDIIVHTQALDVNNHDAVFRVFNQFRKDFGVVDRVIVNAGIGKGGAIGAGHFKENKETFLTNAVSALAQCEAAVEIFRAQNHGHLVTISSVGAVRGFRGLMNVYAASKAALSSLSEGLQIELLHTPIQVSTIHPGFIRTPMNEEAKNLPFAVNIETGCNAIVNAIEKEIKNAYVPYWPWALLHYLLRIAPLNILRKLS